MFVSTDEKERGKVEKTSIYIYTSFLDYENLSGWNDEKLLNMLKLNMKT